MSAASTERRPALERITDEDVAACRSNEALIRALGILGRIDADGTNATCPACNKTDDIKKFKWFEDGGYKHFSRGPDCWGGKGHGLDLLMAEPLNLSFPDAVRALIGKPTSVDIPMPEALPSIKVNNFRAVTDTEVFNGVLTYGRKAFGGEGVRAAQQFYAQWHISPEAVAESGAVYITQPDHFAEQIQARYGLDRLIACGLFVINKNDQPMCLVGHKWPVIEPGKNASGDVTNMQFRASNEQYAKYLRHKAKELPYEGNQKFVNLRGVPTEAYLGCGLDAVAALPAPTEVFWVEGFKDRLAALTMGVSAYGIPGVGFRPPPAVVEAMKPHRVVLSLDGDEAGAAGMYGVREVDEKGETKILKPGLVDHLLEAGLDVAVKPLRPGLDITDSLVLRNLRSGCTCPACTDLAARLPAS